MAALPSARQIQKDLVAEFGAELMAPRPAQAWLFLPLAFGIAALNTLALRSSLPVPSLIAIGLALTLLYSAAIFLTHELLHGSMTRNIRLQTALAYVGLSLFLISPSLWRMWHNKNHHGHTNEGNRDPDSFGTLDRYRRMRSTRVVSRLAPGSGHPLSYLFFFYWFTFHGQVVLWIQSKYLHDFRSTNRRRAKLDTLVMLAGWILLAVSLGAFKSLFVIALPMALTNFTIMS